MSRRSALMAGTVLLVVWVAFGVPLWWLLTAAGVLTVLAGSTLWALTLLPPGDPYIDLARRDRRQTKETKR